MIILVFFLKYNSNILNSTGYDGGLRGAQAATDQARRAANRKKRNCALLALNFHPHLHKAHAITLFARKNFRNGLGVFPKS